MYAGLQQLFHRYDCHVCISSILFLPPHPALCGSHRSRFPSCGTRPRNWNTCVFPNYFSTTDVKLQAPTFSLSCFPLHIFLLKLLVLRQGQINAHRHTYVCSAPGTDGCVCGQPVSGRVFGIKESLVECGPDYCFYGSSAAMRQNRRLSRGRIRKRRGRASHVQVEIITFE